MNIESICVFCGASEAPKQCFKDEARAVGELVASNGYRMVYGAGDCGLMGAAADGALSRGGYVAGIYPNVLDGMEKQHAGLNELIHVPDMHTRKMGMFERSDAFVILPGGFGTMDETFEVITWKQLHTHIKPVILYNYNGYWDMWRDMTEHFIANGFASERTREYYDIVDTRDEVFALLEKYKAA